MARFFLIFFLLLQTQLAFAQSVKTISIDAADARKVNLSEIVEKVTPIALEKSQGMMQSIFLTSECLFVITSRTIVQYDLSGRYIKTIDCERTIMSNNIACDTLKKELYVFLLDKIRCYDYSGKIKREFPFETRSVNCLWHNGFLWAQSYSFQPDASTIYKISKINPVTGEIITLPFELKDEPYDSGNGNVHSIGGVSYLTLYRDEIIAAFGFDNTVYRIQQDRVTPFVRWNGTSSQPAIERNPVQANGFVGEYLFVNYRRSGKFYFYLENMKTGKKYNTNKIIDDIYLTSENCRLLPVNRRDYFYYLKGKSEIKGEKVGDTPLKDGPVVFIVKPK